MWPSFHQAYSVPEMWRTFLLVMLTVLIKSICVMSLFVMKQLKTQWIIWVLSMFGFIALNCTSYFSLWWHVYLCFPSWVRLLGQAEVCWRIWSHTCGLKCCKSGGSVLSWDGGATRPVTTQRLQQQRLEWARRGSLGEVDVALVDVFDGEVTAEHLQEHLPELSGGQIVEEGVEDGAQVEEGVCHREERDVAPEVGSSPLGLRHSRHHEAADLVGKPAQGQGSHNETWKHKPKTIMNKRTK